MRAILLDIEGTTTPIAFVRDTLFPYARRELHAYLALLDDAALQALASAFHEERTRETTAAGDLPPWRADTIAAQRDAIERSVTWLMDRDRKSTALKMLQGRIWEHGYTSGELVAPVYEDVPAALKRWQAQGILAAIYSSGSVHAQQLLFRHSSAGDLTPWLRYHFDTTTGAKTDAESYRRIASAIGLPPSDTVFISDVIAELDAARGAGLRTVLCHRPGEPDPGEGHDHPRIRSFDEVGDATFGPGL